MTFVASSKIQYGAPDGELKIFEPGEVVTGLPKSAMKELWDAGVLRQADEPKRTDGETVTGGSDGSKESTDGTSNERTPTSG